MIVAIAPSGLAPRATRIARRRERYPAASHLFQLIEDRVKHNPELADLMRERIYEAPRKHLALGDRFMRLCLNAKLDIAAIADIVAASALHYTSTPSEEKLALWERLVFPESPRSQWTRECKAIDARAQILEDQRGWPEVQIKIFRAVTTLRFLIRFAFPLITKALLPFMFRADLGPRVA